jgi:hypothetical protein
VLHDGLMTSLHHDTVWQVRHASHNSLIHSSTQLPKPSYQCSLKEADSCKINRIISSLICNFRIAIKMAAKPDNQPWSFDVSSLMVLNGEGEELTYRLTQRSLMQCLALVPVVGLQNYV